jgi:hypothetical protein
MQAGHTGTAPAASDSEAARSVEAVILSSLPVVPRTRLPACTEMVCTGVESKHHNHMT